MRHTPLAARALALIVSAALLSTATTAQDLRRRRAAPAQPGTVSAVQWGKDGKTLSFTNQGQRYRINLTTLEKEDLGEAERGSGAARSERGARSRRGGRGASSGASTGKYIGRPTRGRQYTRVDSPDGSWQAQYRNWNVVLEHATSGDQIQVTEDGNEDIHYGTASWVYGEELGQTRAMWWTADGKKLLYYRFDDTGVQTFYLVRGWSDINTKSYPEYYPKAGAKNPAAELWVYDLETRKNTRIDVGGSSEEYVYAVRSSPDGSVMWVHWTDRLQHNLKLLAMDLDTGKCRVIVEEHQETWQTNKPGMRFLKDGKRFIWTTEKSGYTHYELRDLDGVLHHAITSGDFPCGRLQFVDEELNLVGYTANSSSANPYYAQYHLVGLDGKHQRRVTTLDSHHSNFNLSPDKKWLVAQYEEVNTPPSTALYSSDGKLVTKLAEGDPAAAANLAEMFTFKSDDGRFDIYGILYKPADFDPAKSYPIINALYGGPGSNEISGRYVSRPRAECGRGYLVVKVNNRGTGGRSKAFLGAAYKQLGDVDIQDHADAVRLLRKRPYVDGDRVGIAGHSYGGYMAAMGVFKHPDVYTAAVIGSGVTDWRHYDTIYTERYMSTPQLNKQGYDTGRAMTYVKDFVGHALIMHGMVDDNVHPNNAFQLIAALDKADKRYESRFFPDAGHGLGRGSRTTQWEFFDRILKPQPPAAAGGNR